MVVYLNVSSHSLYQMFRVIKEQVFSQPRIFSQHIFEFWNGSTLSETVQTLFKLLMSVSFDQITRIFSFNEVTDGNYPVFGQVLVQLSPPRHFMIRVLCGLSGLSCLRIDRSWLNHPLHQLFICHFFVVFRERQYIFPVHHLLLWPFGEYIRIQDAVFEDWNALEHDIFSLFSQFVAVDERELKSAASEHQVIEVVAEPCSVFKEVCHLGDTVATLRGLLP